MTKNAIRVLLAGALAFAASIAGAAVVTVRIKMPETVDRTVPFEGKVSALNASYNVDPTYLGTVHFTGTTGVTLPADYTFTPADNGVHTFTFTASRGGHQVVTVADVDVPSMAGSDGFYVVCSELTGSAGNNGPVCANSPVTLFGSSNQTGVSYSWTGPHGWFSQDQNPTAPGPGTYFVEVSNADGCRVLSSTEVGTVTAPAMSLSGSATQACGGETFTVSANDPAPYTDFVWDVSGGTILSGQGTSSIEVQADNIDGHAVAFVRARHTATGCTTPTASHGVSLDPRYVAVLTAPTATCPGTVVTASVPKYAGAAYAWTVTHATNVHDILDKIDFVPDGTGDVVLTATIYNNWATCPSSDTAVVSVSGPTALVDAELAICPGESIDLPVTLGGTPPFNITWSDGLMQNGIATTQTTRTVAPAETTVYSIVSVSDSACSGTPSGSAMITVQESPEILTEPQDDVVLRGQSATLSVEASGSGLTYVWYEGHHGNRSHPVASGPSNEFQTPALQHTTHYWVEVISACGATESSTAKVSVVSRQRSARH